MAIPSSTEYSAGAVPASAGAVAASGNGRPGGASAGSDAPRGRDPFWPRVGVGLLLVAVLGGFVSLLLPSTPTYDPWAWIIWGREITQLDLVTDGGPSWKPLAVLFTVPLSLFGDFAPDLWLVVARAGTFLGLMMAARLAWRLGGRNIPGLVGGAVTAVGLLLSFEFMRSTWLGNSEGLLIGIVLLAIDRHLDGRHRQAFVLGFLAALLRPETWLFLGVYSLWLLWRDRSSLKLIVPLWALVPALWFLPEYWGSGDFLRAANRAAQPNPNSPAFADNPALEVVKSTRDILTLPLEIGAILALLVGVFLVVSRKEGGRTLLILAGAVVTWIGIVALMTERGFSGNPRYLMGATALACVLAGAGWARLIAGGASVAGRRGPRAATMALAGGCVAVLALAAVFLQPRTEGISKLGSALAYQALMRDEVEKAIADVGGPEGVERCGQASTSNYQVPLVAWHLDQHSNQVATTPAPRGVVFQTRANRALPYEPVAPGGSEQVLTNRAWRLFATGCPGVLR